jgi:hypothetical protein
MVMKLDDAIDKIFKEEEIIESEVDITAVKNNPQEGFARALLLLYRAPSETNAKSMMDKMTEVYGKKEISKLLARADEIMAMLKKEQPA